LLRPRGRRSRREQRDPPGPRPDDLFPQRHEAAREGGPDDGVQHGLQALTSFMQSQRPRNRPLTAPGFHSALVLTGSTDRADLARYPYHPTLVVDSIAGLDAASLAAGRLPAPEPPAPLPNGGLPGTQIHRPPTTMQVDSRAA